jgi:hypothetical protein
VLLVELELYQDVSGEHRELTGAWCFNTEEQARVSIPIVGAQRALDYVLSYGRSSQGRHQGPDARRSLMTCPALAE